MKLSTRAVLLSLFVFPGTGHILLKKYRVGWLLISIATSSSLVIFISMMKRAYVIADQLAAGEIGLDIPYIVNAISTPPAGSEATLLTVAVHVLVVVWLGSTADAYRVGRALDS